VSDGERIAAYQLFQIAKKLTSGQLIYLRACYELYKPGDYRNSANVPEHQWFELVSRHMGHTVLGLLNLDDAALAEFELLTRRYRDSGGVNNQNARLSDLGINFCKNIETYRLETSPGAPE
jgi:hypothetical protein